MKLLHLVFLLLIINCSNVTLSQCGPTSVAPSYQATGICEGSSILIDFTTTGNCTGNYEYQIEASGTVYQAWSTTPSFDASPITNTTFTVLARCSSCPATTVSDTFLIQVINQPTIVADTFVCYGTSASFSATGIPGTLSWWDDSIGTTQLSTNENYTTPALTANDSYYVHVVDSVTGVAPGATGSLLITECGLHGFPGSSSADYLEISNLYNTSVNTTGWIVAVSNSYSTLNSVNSTYWQLPSSFDPCSIIWRSDVSGQTNYWGGNILWNPSDNGWAIILDDVGNIIDFVAWGWTSVELAGFNANINGFNITLGPEWIGNGCNAACSPVGGTPYSLSRNGSSDNNNAGDFVCQATSLALLNPGLPCGWAANALTCPYPVDVVVDMPPTASNPANINVTCVADIPAPDPNVVIDELDDYTSTPTVQYMGEVSSGTTCPIVLTRTYRVLDSCSNFVDVTQTITVNDDIDPVMDTPPANVNVECIADVPAMTLLGWTDNCDGTGTVLGTDVSDGLSCPETITRTWTYSDGCGNSASVSQTITVHDITPPTANPLPTVQTTLLPAPDISVVTNASDNCTVPTVAWVSDTSDFGFCPEIITRTYSLTDDCGNVTLLTQEFIVGDPIPDVSFIATPTLLSNLEDGIVHFTNTTTGAVSYEWDFGDLSPISTEENPIHEFENSETAGYIVQLTAYSPFGCSDSITTIISVREELLYYIPNAFTPDGDEYNQVFLPVFESGFDPHDFNCTIFNRWGEVIFESHDHRVGWDGTYHGILQPPGTYIWKIDFGMEYDDSRKVITGYVSIIR